MNKYPILTTIGVIVLIAVVLVATGVIKNPLARMLSREGNADPDIIECVYKAQNGATVTVKGNKNDAEFMRRCEQLKGNEPHTFSGYPGLTFYPYYRYYYSPYYYGGGYYPYYYYTYWPYYGNYYWGGWRTYAI